MRNTKQRSGIFAVLGSALCFGTTGTTQQLGLSHISPLAVASARLLCGAAFLGLFSFMQRKSGSIVNMKVKDLLICGIGIAVYQLAFFSAVRSTGVAIATVTALGSVPTLSSIVAYLVLKEKPPRSWYLGTSVTLLGIVLVGTAHGVASFDLVGIGLAVLAGFGFSIFTVVSRRSLQSGISDLWVATSSFSVSAVVTLPFLFVQNPRWLATWTGGLSILWLGLITSACGYVLYMYGLRRIESSLAATVVLAEPATATVLAAVVIGEKLVSQSYIGITTVAFGILYLSRKATT